jgi:citrate lyase subunit beta/citryl-CoA lyase
MRSLLYTPGHRAEMVAKVLNGGLPVVPDVALLDLEDGVPPSKKENARQVIASALDVTARTPDRSVAHGPLRFVRIRPALLEDAELDIRAVVRPGLDGLVVPKLRRAEELELLDDLIAEPERAADLARGAIVVIASIESAAGLLEAPRIARAPRVSALMFGCEDFAADLGLPTRREAEAAEMIYARSAIVIAAAAAGALAFDGIWADIRDEAGLRADALRGRRLGFAGRQCIHPSQVGVVNEIFSPSVDEIAHAARVVEAFDDGVAKGLGAVALDGEMLDAPIVERARRVLRTAR